MRDVSSTDGKYVRILYFKTGTVNISRVCAAPLKKHGSVLSMPVGDAKSVTEVAYKYRGLTYHYSCEGLMGRLVAESPTSEGGIRRLPARSGDRGGNEQILGQGVG